MGDSITIRLRCFSHVRDVLDTGELELSFAPGATADDVAIEVRRRANGRLDGLPFRLAVNQEFVAGDAALTDGDEVALIPPVQGG